MGVLTTCHMFINCRLGSCCSGFIFRRFFFSIICQSLQCKGGHSVNKRVHRLFLTVLIYQVYPSVTPRFVAAFYTVWRLLAHQLCWRRYVIASEDPSMYGNVIFQISKLNLDIWKLLDTVLKHWYILNSQEPHWCYPNCLQLVWGQSRALTLPKLCKTCSKIIF